MTSSPARASYFSIAEITTFISLKERYLNIKHYLKSSLSEAEVSAVFSNTLASNWPFLFHSPKTSAETEALGFYPFIFSFFF